MKFLKPIGLVSMLAGIVMIVAGAVTWGVIGAQLASENITVPEDSQFMGGYFQGKQVSGPLSAYAQAEIIEQHSLEMSGGKTYAELDREDPVRETMMTASFLRASLFTSIVSYGIAAFVMGTGLMFGLIGLALTRFRPAAPAPATQ